MSDSHNMYHTADNSHNEYFLLLTTLIESMQSGILFEDESRRVVLADELFCTMFGIPMLPKDIIGGDCRAAAEAFKGLMGEPDLFVERIEEIICSRKVVINDVLHLVDGRILERDHSPIFMDGRHLGYLWQYRDITIRRYSENALRKIEEENRAIVNAVPDILFRLRRDGLFLDYHTPVSAVLYAPPEVFLGKYIQDVLPPDVARQAAEAIESAFVT